jgi:hypothetical protein
MTVSSTSKNAYNAIYSKIGDKQRKVYEAIGELGIATNEQIAEYLDWPINCVTGRVTELRKFGMVGVEGIQKGSSGHSAKAWGVRDMGDDMLTQLIKECGA